MAKKYKGGILIETQHSTTQYTVPLPHTTRNRMMITTNTGSKKRGAFILLEGVDRCGKTTQVSLLTKHLLNLSLATVAYRFPDRTTQGQYHSIGKKTQKNHVSLDCV